MKINKRLLSRQGLSSVVRIGSHCEKACNPRMGNIAIGRSLRTQTTCGYNNTELFCTYSEKPDQTCNEPKCDKCNTALPRLSHPPSAMADSTFKLPRTWWQSTRDTPQEVIQLDLEAKFYFTHLIMVFKSPRPAAMILERSRDFGLTWRPYKFFATNCPATFQLADDVVEKGSLCTSRYSQAFPCSGGEASIIKEFNNAWNVYKVILKNKDGKISLRFQYGQISWSARLLSA
ncbi:netrin-4 isoform X1 [Pelobates cultripes]|uniref:Netrin-4 isoform X1 n=1 Tax=Pelobates cultripes TaxID=61616 RepID=A0AAD1VZH0_PELCU|nr:netrin-4 isoform X1 [Pelobates cultripes]